MLIAKVIDKLEEKGHGGCVALGIAVLVFSFFILSGFNACHSCANSSHSSYNYYDHVRK